jgi:hypothetical protein
MRRVVRSLLFVGAAAAALSLAGPDALMPFKDVAGAATEVSVAFVVDFGGSTGPVVGCVTVPSNDNGYEALAAFTNQQHEQMPRYDPSGLLCAINGVPSSGCGQTVSGGYNYWSYWHGSTGTWSYATTGAFATVTSGDVEGWRFEVHGKSNPNDHPPGMPPDYNAICPPSPPPSPPPSTPDTAPSSSPGSPSVTTTTSGSSSPGVAPGSSGGTTSSTAPQKATSPTTAASGSKPAGAGHGTTRHPGSSGPSGPPTTAVPERHARPLNVSTTSVQERQGTSFIPLLVTGAIVAALIVVAALRWRKRPYTQ